MQVPNPRTRSTDKKQGVAEEMQALIDMSVYEEVDETEQQEEHARNDVISGRWEERQRQSRSKTASGKMKKETQSSFDKAFHDRLRTESASNVQRQRRQLRRRTATRRSDIQVEEEETVTLRA